MGFRRSRPPRELPGWAAELAQPRVWTTIGTVGSPWRARVDACGRLMVPGQGWVLDWWIGADDRWHVPSREAAVRQHLIDLSPVVETAMRVPSGDVVQRVFAVVDPAGAFAMVEIANRSPVPVALAVSTRPSPPGRVERVTLDSEHNVVVDDRTALLLPRRPRRFVTSTRVGGDVADRVMSTESTAATDAPIDPPARCLDGLAQAAVMYPLAHGAVLRFAVPLAAVRRGVRYVSLPHAPEAEAVARGWTAQARRGMRLVLPESRLADAVEAARRSLLVTYRSADDLESVVAALDRFGFHDEVAEVLGSPRRWARSRKRSRAGSQVGSDDTSPYALARLAVVELERGDRRALLRLDAIVNESNATFSWPDDDGPVSAVFLLLVRHLLVREDVHGLAVCSMLPEDWKGQPIEVHDAPTDVGRLSFGIRWHGPRPVLLWELIPHEPSRSVRLRAPALDPTWSTVEPSGEALLSGLPIPAGAVE